MSGLPALAALLHLALMGAAVACVSGATIGVYVLMRPHKALRIMGLAPVDDPAAAGIVEARARLGGLVAAPHGVCGVVLMLSPRIGACMAATLAVMWLGSACARAASLLVDAAAGRRAAGPLLLEAVMAAVLATPLWAYLEIIQANIMATAI